MSEDIVTCGFCGAEMVGGRLALGMHEEFSCPVVIDGRERRRAEAASRPSPAEDVRLVALAATAFLHWRDTGEFPDVMSANTDGEALAQAIDRLAYGA